MERLLRPYGLILDGRLELGLEINVVDGVIREVRPHSGIPDSFVISPAFVNAHSHLEYRGLQGALQSDEYWPWIREITLAKRSQPLQQVRSDTELAARENRAAGVAVIAEHSDRPFAAKAMKEAGLRGVVFQEVITRFEPSGPTERLGRAISDCHTQGRESGIPCFLAPHAFQTVDEQTLRWIGSSKSPFSMHVAETELENDLALTGGGPIGDTFAALGITFAPTGKRLIPTLDELGLLRKGAQLVHCCALTLEEVHLLARREVAVAHCPRSNINLGCPAAPVREMLDAGLQVGLGLDSSASSGPIDMFAEMRSAVESSVGRGRPVAVEEVWHMATGMGAESLEEALPNLPAWRIEPGSEVPLMAIHVEGALSTDELVQRATPSKVEWLTEMS